MWFLFKITYEIKILGFFSTFANEPVFKLVLGRLKRNTLTCWSAAVGADVVIVVGTRKGMFPSWLY